MRVLIRQLKFANGVETGFDLLAYVPPHRAPRVVVRWRRRMLH